MARWRIVVGVAVVLVLAVATAFVVASSFREEPTVAWTEPVAAGPSPSPSPTAGPTVDPDPMPELHNTGEDFDRIVRSIEEFRDWLFRNPDPQRVGEIYHPECECHDALADKLARLRDDGVKVSSGRVLIVDITVMDRENGVVAIRVVDSSEPTVFVDEDGNIVDSSDGWDQRAYRYLLQEDATGRWLVRDIASMALDATYREEGDG